MEIEQKNIEAIAQYFYEGCKSDVERYIGVETEHFIIDKQGNPITYKELDGIMQQLVKKDDHIVREDGNLLGYYNEEFSITLEPAAQLEISVMPQKDIKEIERILKEFYKNYGSILQKAGFEMVNVGYHPTRKADDLSLIPKKRYEYMNAYFAHSGTRGYQMMRATASTQVAVDYLSEEDFVKKYRLACILAPVFSLLAENCPIYEGQKSERFLTRSYVWQDVDDERCRIPDGIFCEDFGFRRYAEELYYKPPILVREGDFTQATGNKTIAQWYEGKALTKEEIEHLVSMFFPDVRLKQYLEIRPADSLPIEYTLAYVSLVRGIFYNSQNVDKLMEYFCVNSKQQIWEAKRSLMEHGYAGEVYGKPVGKVMDFLFVCVMESADEDEKRMLKPLADLAVKRMTPAEYLWKDLGGETRA